ncbi:MAG: tRNA (adenosine(37)-N6)-threonylcarbamoyltransferase complex dimerization subunit type 1 TsaB [Betaproteobacteria bacterium]|nr:tRNA (adenosine(37)-N6)-threonylcarbamoyltransferase complex dimerization subunit type 1 TsaB [Betaproteobacteria bacterium]
MNLLALDTSTDRLCMALCSGEAVHAHEEPGGPQASQRLLPAAQALLVQRGLTWRDLDGLAFGQGPGAFTGLRGTCAAVQGLCLGLGVSAVAVPSLLIVAEDARQQALDSGQLKPTQACTVAVAMDARMGQVYDDQAHWDGRHWRPMTSPLVRSPSEVAESWQTVRAQEADRAHQAERPGHDRQGAAQGTWLYAGSGLDLMPLELAGPLRHRAALWAPHVAHRGAALGRCAVAAWAAGPRLDAAQVMPWYVRDRVALTTAERRAQGASAVMGLATGQAR